MLCRNLFEYYNILSRNTAKYVFLEVFLKPHKVTSSFKKKEANESCPLFVRWCRCSRR